MTPTRDTVDEPQHASGAQAAEGVQRRVHLRGHLPVLDGVRGLAILFVVVYHSNIIARPSTTAEHLWLGVVNAGWSGVDLFFVLSGFLITGILYDAKGKAGYFKIFWLRRILRIFPLYYLFLAVSFYGLPRLVPVLNDITFIKGLNKASPEWFWTYLPNLLFAKEGDFLGPQHLHATWSLGVEEQFYVVWPVVVFLLGRRGLLRVCAAGIVGALVLRLWMLAEHVHWITIFVLPVTRMDTLLVGAALALWLRGREEQTADNEGADDRNKDLAFWATVAFASGMAVVVLYSISAGYLAQFNKPVHSVGFTILAVMFGALLLRAVLAAEGSRLGRLMAWAPLRFLGRYSYGLYLSHPIIQDLVVRHLLVPQKLHYQLWESRIIVQVIYSTVSTFIAVAFAFVLFHAFERHFLALKRFFPMPSRAPSHERQSAGDDGDAPSSPSAREAESAPSLGADGPSNDDKASGGLA